MSRLAIVLLALLVAGPAFAQEPRGCDKFKWKLDTERAMLTSADVVSVPSGIPLEGMPPKALAVKLVPFAGAKLAMAPERAPKDPASFAGFVRVETRPKAGPYLVTLSAEGWVDVVQNGKFIKSSGFSGVQGCEGIRKSVRFDLTAEPFAVQVTGVTADTIRMTITPAAQ